MGSLPALFFIFGFSPLLAFAANSTASNCKLSSYSSLYFPKDDCSLVCRPTKWSDVIVFYLGNYVAHAATATSVPGQSIFSTAMVVLTALLFPAAGMVRGYEAIRSLAIFANTELQTAAKAGALCMVAKEVVNDRRRGYRNSWDVEEGYEMDDQDAEGQRELVQQRPELVTIMASKIQGRISLPRGWTLTTVSADATFENDNPEFTTLWKKFKRLFQRDSQQIMKLSSNYSFVKAIVAIGQTIFASATLYRSKGDQIDRFGYAAFGLTVAPYAFMSLINFIGNVICPEYPAMYIVKNTELDRLLRIVKDQEKEAEFYVEGAVGRIFEPAVAAADRIVGGNAWVGLEYLALAKYYVTVAAASAVPLTIIGGISHFQRGESTHAQRVWIMTWLVWGMFTGVMLKDAGFVESWRQGGLLPTYIKAIREVSIRVSSVSMFMVNSVPAIGGFVVVGQMIQTYGVCLRIS